MKKATWIDDSLKPFCNKSKFSSPLATPPYGLLKGGFPEKNTNEGLKEMAITSRMTGELSSEGIILIPSDLWVATCEDTQLKLY